MHAFLSNLANRQTDRQTQAKTCTFFFVRGNKETAMKVALCLIEKNTKT